MNITTDIPVIGALMKAIGIEDFWFLLAILFFIICVILLAALISSTAKRRKLSRELDEANEYATGLEALTHLPPIKYTEDGELGPDSVVFASVREVKHMEKTGEIPVLRYDPLPPVEDTVAMPRITPDIAAAVKAEAEPVTPEKLAAAIPEVRGGDAPVNVTAAVHDAILASVSGKHKAITAQRAAEKAEQPSAQQPAIRPLSEEERSGLKVKIPQV